MKNTNEERGRIEQKRTKTNENERTARAEEKKWINIFLINAP
jgi:hypothetical protein